MVRAAKAVILAGTLSMALALPVAAADKPVVLQVIAVKVKGDMGLAMKLGSMFQM